MTRKRKHILVVESRPEDAQMMRDAFNAVPDCGECIVCRNPGEVRAYLSGAGVYDDRAAYPFPDAVLFSLEPEEGADLDLLHWVGRITGARVVVLFEGPALTAQDLAVANAITLEKPEDGDGLEQLLKDVARLLCAGSNG